MKLYCHLRAAALCALSVWMLAPALLAQQYTFRQFGPSDGLTNLGVNCLFQDHTGYLWVGTDNGLFRFDGSSFEAFGHSEGLANSEIRNLAESPTGDLWAATQGGVIRRSGGNFQTVDVGPTGQFLDIAFDPHGNLYLEHNSGILRGTPDGKGAYRFSMIAPGAVGAMLVHGDEVWFRRDGELWRFSDDKVERVGTPAGLPSDLWGAVALDTLGNLWVRSAARLYELPHGQTRFVDRSEGIPHALVTRLFTDTHGRVFVSSNSGVVMLSGAHDSERTYIDAQHGLPADVAGPVLLDREESLWLGMRGGGLVRRLGHGEWLSWRKADGLLNDSVWSTLNDRNGRLWVGTTGGLSIFAADGKLAHAWTSRNGLIGDSVFALAADPAGDVFAGTNPSGVSRFTPEGELKRSYGAAAGLTGLQINALAIDSQHHLWAVGLGGCFRSIAPLDKTNDLKFEAVSIPGVPPRAYFHDVQMGEGENVWVSTSNGLARFDGSRWRVFTKADGLQSDDLVDMALGHGELWIAYRDALGIARLQFQGDQLQVSNVTQQDGLSSDLSYALAFDHAGRLWDSTDNGVDVLERDSQGQGRWRHYGAEDGLIWDDGDDLALSVDQLGAVWIGTSRGLSRYAAPAYAIPDLPSAIVLTSIHGVSQEFQAQDRPVLAHAQNSLIIQFSGLNYSSDSRTRYRYRLLGSKNTWTETHEKSVHFEGLPGGDYVFEVIAAGPNGMWSTVPARFSFTVKPPWWLSWWFILLFFVVALLLARAIWRFRVRVLLAQKEHLERLVIDRTTELRESHRQLEEIAYYDMLTSLPNRRMFTEQFRSRLALSRRHGTPFALLLIDLDSFKQTNDSFGHDAGDAVLTESAKLLQSAVRESDCVARLGGDEFAILLISPTDPAGIAMVAGRIVDSFEAGIPFKGTKLPSSCSLGIAVFPGDGDTQESLYKSSDLALYEAKRMGGGTWRRYQIELATEPIASEAKQV